MMTIRHVFDNGAIFEPEVLEISESDIIKKFQHGANLLTAASLEAGFPNELSVKHSVLNAFKNLVAVTFESDASFKQAEDLKKAAAAAPVAAAAPAAAGKFFFPSIRFYSQCDYLLFL
jgi:large subunit ribosomal protein LP0